MNFYSNTRGVSKMAKIYIRLHGGGGCQKRQKVSRDICVIPNTNSLNTVPESHQIDLSQFMNEAIKTFKTAKTAIKTIVNE